MTQYGDFFYCEDKEQVHEALGVAAEQASELMRELKINPVNVGKVELFIKNIPEDSTGYTEARVMGYKHTVAWKFSVDENDVR